MDGTCLLSAFPGAGGKGESQCSQAPEGHGVNYPISGKTEIPEEGEQPSGLKLNGDPVPWSWEAWIPGTAEPAISSVALSVVGRPFPDVRWWRERVAGAPSPCHLGGAPE